MKGRVRLNGQQIEPLTAGWEMLLTPPLAVSDSAALNREKTAWIPAFVPSTAASVLREAGLWSLDGPPRRFDAEDVWYRTKFSIETGANWTLCLDGLATIAEVWLNNERVLTSENMFIAHEISLENCSGEIELVLGFRSLDAHLKVRHPRPRWRAPMVENQQIRWVRTTLLGRTPGWSPPAAPVGPWRAIYLKKRGIFQVNGVKISAHLENSIGFLEFEAQVSGAESINLILERNEESWNTPLTIKDCHAKGILRVENVQQWWPHTHGEPALYKAKLRAGEEEADLGFIGFRSIDLNTQNGDFALSINGAPVFCRGACWTPPDVVFLNSSSEEIEKSVLQARDAGFNMLRVTGTMTPESDAFFDACDKYGILVWHDFMFANLDYPDEENFNASVKVEANQLLSQLTGRPCLAVLCGNSEVEQQAAMWGATREYWEPRLFHEILPELAKKWCPYVPYWPSSAHGGAVPHQPNCGTASYYGVGAYLRPLDDARRSQVRFATECLAFANVPDEANLAAMPGGLSNRAHHPNWKARTPRDLGAGWDFDDVRDHYVKLLFGVDPVALRSIDHNRYLELSRVTTGEVMAATFAEWRRATSPTQGALILMWRDLWAGAGWGIIDSQGKPKAAYHYLRRALQPLHISISDEGLNGLYLHLINEHETEFTGSVSVEFFRDYEFHVGTGNCDIGLKPRENREINVGVLFGHFVDANYAYRFGAPPHNLVVASLHDSDGELRSQTFYFPLGLPYTKQRDLGLRAQVQPLENGDWILNVHSRAFAQSVYIDVAGFESEDNYFHVEPNGFPREIILRRVDASKSAPIGTLQALNCESSVSISIP